MLTEELGLARSDAHLVSFESERWDGWGFPMRTRGEEIPLPVRIVHVARDAAFQSTLTDADSVAGLIAERGGAGFDPEIAAVFASAAGEFLSRDPQVPLWNSTLAAEPKPWQMLEGEKIDRALAAMGHFADLAVPDFVGHSSGDVQAQPCCG